MESYQRNRHYSASAEVEIGRPLIVVGITHPQTCLVLTGRLRALREAGFRVVLLASPGVMLNDMGAQEGVETLAIPMERAIAPFADLVSLLRLLKALHRLRPDITEFSTPKAGLLGSLAALGCGVPHRVYVLRGLRLETASGIKRWVLRAAEQIAAACCHVVLCNSQSLRDTSLALGIAGESKLRLLGHGSGNGVDVTRFAPGVCGLRSKLNIPARAPVVGFVGRLTRDKGVLELIEAFDTLLQSQPDARLLLVGWFDESEDALPAYIRDRIDSHPQIVRTGFVVDT